MKYVSIDLETTGLDPQNHQIIEIGMVIDDLVMPLADCPRFSALVRPDGDINGEAYALALNANILRDLADPKYQGQVIDEYALLSEMEAWFGDNGLDENITAAGKNFASFDLPFLNQLGRLPFHHRSIDPGTLWLIPGDLVVPDMKTCKARAEMLDTEVKHRALDDALDVCALIRRKYGIYK